MSATEIVEQTTSADSPTQGSESEWPCLSMPCVEEALTDHFRFCGLKAPSMNWAEDMKGGYRKAIELTQHREWLSFIEMAAGPAFHSIRIAGHYAKCTEAEFAAKKPSNEDGMRACLTLWKFRSLEIAKKRLSYHGKLAFYTDAFMSLCEPANGVENPEVFESFKRAYWKGLWAFWVGSNGVVLVSRPIIKLDENGRLHCSDGPAIFWNTRTQYYFWHGVHVPREIVEKPDSVTFDSIRKEPNTEVRRVMIERYGSERYRRESRAEVIDEDEHGTLCQERIPVNGEPMVFVRVRNSTPEPDGSFRHYELRVLPHIQTARQAVAWTFGLQEDDYEPITET